MTLDNLFDETVLRESEKQLTPKPPTYEESLRDILEGKTGVYVDPQHFPLEYDEDMDNEILNDLGIQNYDSVEKALNQPEMTQQKTENILIRLSMMLN